MRSHHTVPLCLLALSLLALSCSDPAGPRSPTDNADAAHDAADATDVASDAPVDTAQDIAVDVPEHVVETIPPLAERLEPDRARAGIVTDARELIGGLKADGKVGDVKLYNAHVAFIVEGARRASGYRFYGGNIVDGDVIRAPGEPGQDLFGEIIPTWNLAIFSPETVEVLDDGSAGGVAHVRISGRSGAFAFPDSFIRDVLNPAPVDLDMTYDYYLGPDDQGVRFDVTLHNRELVLADMAWPVLLSNHGDGLRQWVPGIGYGFDFGVVDALTLTSGSGLAYSLVSDDSYELIFDYSNVGMMKADAFQIPGDGEVVRTYHMFVTDRGAEGIDRLIATERGAPEPARLITGRLTLPEGAPVDEAYVVLWDNLDPVTFAPLEPDGSFTLHGEAKDYFVIGYVPGYGSSSSALIEVGDPSTDLRLTIPAQATLRVTVQNAAAQPVPARITVVAEEADSPSSPERVRHGSKGDWRWLDGRGEPGYKVSAVGLATEGVTTVSMPAGRYTVFATRGFSYTIAEEPVTLIAGQQAALPMRLDKVVDTTGWISADFHVHAVRSPDSDTPLDLRVRQAVTEELNLPILTEHVTLGGLQPTIDALGLGDEVVGPFGQEVTTFVYGHFTAFPLSPKPDEPNFGAVFPYDKTPQQLLDAIRDQAPTDEIIQVAHPRQGVPAGYFDFVRYDPLTGAPRRPEGWSTNWDTIEVFSARCLPDADNTMTLQDWVAMTNLGQTPTLSSGSDTHFAYEPPGMPRSWVRADLDAIRANGQVLVDTVRARKMFVSCGPFVTFETEDGKGLGERAMVDASGEVGFKVRVQAPTWMTLDVVRLYRNGEQVLERTDLDNTRALRFDDMLTDTPQADAWYTVEVVGSGSLWPVHPLGSPYAYTNPIEVDADRDGQWDPPGLP